MFEQESKRLHRVISVRQDSLAVEQQTSQLLIVAAVTTIGKMFSNLLAYSYLTRHRLEDNLISSFTLLLQAECFSDDSGVVDPNCDKPAVYGRL